VRGRILRAVVAGAFAVVLLQAGQVSAHHSFGMFDTTQRVAIDGVVKEFRMVNPHSFIVMTVKGAEGKEAEWWIEAHSLLVLKRQGWTRNSLKAGDPIHLTINPLRTAQPGGYMLEATVNGQLVGQRAQP
jgi:hypothetical protein